MTRTGQFAVLVLLGGAAAACTGRDTGSIDLAEPSAKPPKAPKPPMPPPEGACTADFDCEGDPEHQRCDPDAGRCVQCLTAADCAPIEKCSPERHCAP